MKAINLKCLGMINPLGIDEKHPRITWNIDSGQRQIAFEVIYSINGGIKRTSGKKISSSMNYTFEDNFNSRDKVIYTVKVFDGNNTNGTESDKSSFEFGLLNKEDFLGKFISGDYKINKKYRYPVSCFRKKFLLNSFTKARLYITSLGNYDVTINKRKITGDVLTPGYTNYKKRVQYQTYDVGEYIKIGQNELEIEVSDGYFRGSIGDLGKTYVYGKSTAVLFQLEVFNGDKKEVFVSDESLEFSDDGKYIFTDMKDGEVIDASQEPSYDGKVKAISYKNQICSSNSLSVTKHETYVPKIYKVGENLYMLDFGKLINGFLGFNFTGIDGDSLFIKLGVSLNERGQLEQNEMQKFNSIKAKYESFIFKDGYVANLKENDQRKVSPLQIIKYRGRNGENSYETKFSIFGFRYALVNTKVDITTIEFYAVAVYSNFKTSGNFICNNKLINKFIENSILTIKDISLDIPTFSPFYDRSGNLAESLFLFNSASYLFDYYPLARKYCKDIFDTQTLNGSFLIKAPYGDISKKEIKYSSSYGFGDAGILLSYYIFNKYGDDSIVKENYEVMSKFGKSLMKKCGHRAIISNNVKISDVNRKYLLNKGISIGDFGESKEVFKPRKFEWLFPKVYENTLYAHLDFKALSYFSHIFSGSDEAKFIEYENGTKKAFNELLIKKNYSLDTNRQSKLVLPIYFSILNEQYDKFAKQRLVKIYEENGHKTNVGNMTGPYFIFALFDSNKDLAYAAIESERADKWLYLCSDNTTTLFEKTFSDQINHFSKITLVDFLFSRVAGINVVKENYFEIKPSFGGTITNVNCEYNSVYGLVKVSYKRDIKSFNLTVNIPGNCDASLILPSGKKVLLHAGIHNFNEYL